MLFQIIIWKTSFVRKDFLKTIVFRGLAEQAFQLLEVFESDLRDTPLKFSRNRYRIRCWKEVPFLTRRRFDTSSKAHHEKICSSNFEEVVSSLTVYLSPCCLPFPIPLSLEVLPSGLKGSGGLSGSVTPNVRKQRLFSEQRSRFGCKKNTLWKLTSSDLSTPQSTSFQS